MVCSALGSDLRSLPRWFNRLVLKRCDGVVAAGCEMERLALRLGLEGVRTIWLPVDECRLFSEGQESVLRQELRLGRATPIVTFLGRLEPFKDPLTFVNAIPAVLENCSHCRFVVVGDGPLLGSLKLRARELGVMHSVTFVGWRSDVHRYLHVSDVAVGLSPIENVWSMTLVEAHFAGVPCIVTEVGMSRNLFAHGENCYMIPARRPDALAEAILTLLGDAALRGKLAQGARTLLSRHGWYTHQIADSVARLYEDVLRGRKRSSSLEV